MKKVVFLFFVAFAFLWAKSPLQLVQEGACYWPAEKTNEGTNEVILKKGCLRYYTEKSKGCSVNFSTRKIKEDGEVQEILVANWLVSESTKDGKTKIKGSTKFVVDSRDGEEGLFPFETMVDCKGGGCKTLEESIISMVTEMAKIFDVYDLSGMKGLWNRTFSIDKESALYFVNHAVAEETFKKLMLRSMLGSGEKITLDALDPVYFVLMMGLSSMECPSIKKRETE